MQDLFAALLERIEAPLRPERGVTTDSSILLIYPPENELDFREQLVESFLPHLRAAGIPFTHLDLTGFLFHDLDPGDVEILQEDEFDDYRWMRQGLSQRVEAALARRFEELTSEKPGATLLVSSTVALHPLVRYGEVLRGLRGLKGRIALAFPGAERGGKLHFMNQPDGGNYLAVKLFWRCAERGAVPQERRA